MGEDVMSDLREGNGHLKLVVLGELNHHSGRHVLFRFHQVLVIRDRLEKRGRNVWGFGSTRRLVVIEGNGVKLERNLYNRELNRHW